MVLGCGTLSGGDPAGYGVDGVPDVGQEDQCDQGGGPWGQVDQGDLESGPGGELCESAAGVEQMRIVV